MATCLLGHHFDLRYPWATYILFYGIGPRRAPAGTPWWGARSVRSHAVRAATRPLSSTRRLQPRLAPATTDLGVLMGIRIGQRVGRLLQIRHQVIRGPTGGAFDARILDDRLVRVDEHLGIQRQGPRVGRARVLARR